MAFATRLDLANAIASWLNRSNLTAQIPDFIRLTEVRLNRLLRDPDQLITTTINLSSGSGTIPADFGQMVALGDAGTRLTQVTPGEFGTYSSVAGDPKIYTVGAGVIRVLPGSGSASTPITYYRAIPALTADGSTNWLLTRAPDIYLYGSLLQAEFYGWNDERLGTIKAAYDEAIAELRVDGEGRRWGAAPMAPKLGRT